MVANVYILFGAGHFYIYSDRGVSLFAYNTVIVYCKISAQPHTILCIQFLDRVNNYKNNTFPLGKQICFTIIWGCAEILPLFALFCCKARRKRLEHEKSVGRNTRRSRVFLKLSLFLCALQQNRAQFCCLLFAVHIKFVFACFTTEQSTDKASLFVS